MISSNLKNYLNRVGVELKKVKNLKFDIIFSAIILLSFCLRIIAIIYLGDDYVANEWQILLKNLEEKNILSVRDVGGVPVPNIFMPPLYPFFLYSIKFLIFDFDNFLLAVHTIQLFLSLLSIYLMYKILLDIYSNKISYFGTLAFAIFPLNIYAASQISSITIQLFLLCAFLYNYIKIFNSKKIYHTILFSFSAGLLILLRGEFFIFVILSLIYLFLKNKDFKNLIFTVFLIILIISPYVYRNYQIFETLTITKSVGYNLLKGNNPSSKVEGIGMFKSVGKVVPDVKPKLDKLISKGPIKKHDLLVDRIFLDQAVKYIKDNPVKYIKLYFKKAASFILIDLDSSYPNYYSIFNTLPKILLSITTLISIFFLIKLKVNIYNYLILYFFSNIGLFSFFFILPRYNLSLLPVQIILSLYLIKKIRPNF